MGWGKWIRREGGGAEPEPEPLPTSGTGPAVSSAATAIPEGRHDTVDSLPPISDSIDFTARDEVLARLRELDDAAAPAVFESPSDPAPPSSELVAETGATMGKLQNAQKAVADLGLSARVSIDLVARRPTRERVSRTLQDIPALRTALRRFEELLSKAKVEVWGSRACCGKTRSPNSPW